MLKNTPIDYDDEECGSFFFSMNEIDYYVKAIERLCKALYQNGPMIEIANKNSELIDSVLTQRLGYYESLTKKNEWGTVKDVLTFQNGNTGKTCAESIEENDNDLRKKLVLIHKGLGRVCDVRSRKHFQKSEYSKQEDTSIYSDLSQIHEKLQQIYQMDSYLLEPYRIEIEEAEKKMRYREKRGIVLSELKRALWIAGVGATILVTGVNVSASIGRKKITRNVDEPKVIQPEGQKTQDNFKAPSEEATIQDNIPAIRRHPDLQNLTYEKLKKNRGIMREEVYREGLKMLAEEAVGEMSPQVISCLAQAVMEANENHNNVFVENGINIFQKNSHDLAIDFMKAYYDASIHQYTLEENTALSNEAFLLRYATRNLINYNTACLYNKPMESTGIYSQRLDKASLIWTNEKGEKKDIIQIEKGKEKTPFEKFVMATIQLAPQCRKNQWEVNNDMEFNDVVSSFLWGGENSFKDLLDLTSALEHNANRAKAMEQERGEK